MSPLRAQHPDVLAAAGEKMLEPVRRLHARQVVLLHYSADRAAAASMHEALAEGFEVSEDGNTIYWAGYSNKRVDVYSRASEFDEFGQQPDSVLNQFPADVTHIKFIEGEIDRQLDMLKLIGNLRIEVLEQE